MVLACATGAAQSAISGQSSQANANWPASLVTGPSLVSIAISPAAPTQIVGSGELFTATGTFSDGSTSNVTQSAIWSTGTPSVATFGTVNSQQPANCISGGTSLITATSGSVSGSTTLTCVATGATAGCGAGPGGTNIYDQSQCGNYAGAPYEDLATASSTTPPNATGSGSVHTIPAGSCPSTIVPTAGDVWRFGGNISDGVGGTTQKCIYFGGQSANNFTIDLAGYSLTGGIQIDQALGGNGADGITIVNGTITCNIANGGSTACIYFNESANPAKSVLWSHLTISNINSPANPDTAVVTSNTCQLGAGSSPVVQPYCGFEFAGLYVSSSSAVATSVPPGSNQKTFNGAQIEMAHLTITNASAYTGAGYPPLGWCGRCTDVQIDGAASGTGGVSVEAWNNVINNGAYTDANQGIVCFNTGNCTMHNNYAPWVTYSGTQDTGRPFLFDAAGKNFNQNGGQAFNNYVQVANNRCVRTRQVNNIGVHDNLFSSVQSTTVDPCIMMGGNGDYAEKISGNLVSQNTFTMAGGTAIEAAESYGLVANANTFTCLSNCSAGILGAAWLQEGGGQGLIFNINTATRTAPGTGGCVVTLNLANGPSTTSQLNGVVYVNVSGTGTDFDIAGTAGNVVTTVSGTTVTYTQSGCAGANSYTYSSGAAPIFWMAQNSTDNYPANGSQLYVKNSIVDPQLTGGNLFVACGATGSALACGNPPLTNQAEILWCNNTQNGTLVSAIGGAGATVTHQTPDASCP